MYTTNKLYCQKDCSLVLVSTPLLLFGLRLFYGHGHSFLVLPPRSALLLLAVVSRVSVKAEEIGRSKKRAQVVSAVKITYSGTGLLVLICTPVSD